MTLRGRLWLGTLVLHVGALPASGLAQEAGGPSSPLVSRGGVAVAGLLLAGALLSDQELREETLEHRGTTSQAVARLGNLFGDGRVIVPALAAGYLAGELAESSELKGAVLRASAAVGLAAGVTTGLKYGIGRLRPDVSDRSLRFRPFGDGNAFPSGHTAAAFALATVAAEEARDGRLDALFYGIASLTALARVNDNRHWASDVIAGAIVGHLSARWVSRALGPVRVGSDGVGVRVEF